MKHNEMTSRGLLLLLVAGLSFQSCKNDYVGGELPPDNGSNEPPRVESDYFNFSTQKSVTLQLNYGKFAANALLSVYTTDPYEGSLNNDSITKTPDFCIFADENGSYRGTTNLPSYTEKVWVQVAAYGLPAMTEIALANGVATFNASEMAKEAPKRNMTRSGSDGDYELRKVWTDNQNFRTYSYIDWDKQAKIDYTKHSNLFSNGKLSAEDVKAIRDILWQGNATKPSKYGATRLNNSHLLRNETDLININIQKPTKLYMTFLHESTDFTNTVGYYVYKTGEVPGGGLRETDKYVIYPNASTGGTDEPLLEYGLNNAKNLRTQMLFVDPEDGSIKEEFPAGYTVGFFIIPRGWNKGPGTISIWDKWGIYSNREKNWNDPARNLGWAGLSQIDKGFISLRMKDGTLVYGMEDGYVDLSYDDVLFSVDASNVKAIPQDDRPLVVPSDKEIYATETTYNTYAYEDMWPAGGDYDLNDVIILHKREVLFGSKDNEVKKIIDTFTPIQPAGAATYKDAFAVQLDQLDNYVESTELGEGMTKEDDTHSIIVTDNTNANRGKEFVITRNFKTGVKKVNITEDINPYVIAQYKEGDMMRNEIHIAKHKATERCNPSLINTGDDAFFIDLNGKFPFGISLPIKDFQPAAESQRIDKAYPRFTEWVTSKGQNATDWYLIKE